MDKKMPLYFFRISKGRYSGASDLPHEFDDHERAWAEMTAICSNLVASISRNLQPNAEWRMELLNEMKEPIFRVRLVGETAGKIP
jgi:hypothetical protein